MFDEPLEARSSSKYIIFKYSLRISKKTRLHYEDTKIIWLMLCKEITAVYSENRMKPIGLHSVGRMLNYWLLKQVVHIVTTEISSLKPNVTTWLKGLIGFQNL
jgi:hypothetical protein